MAKNVVYCFYKPTGLFLCTASMGEGNRMLVQRIRLHDFRNYRSLDLRPPQGLCVLVGENAAGKTNVLESLFLCALGRSHRTRHDIELIRSGQEGAFVGLELTKATGTHSIDCRIYQEGRRLLRIDGKPLARSGELLGCLRAVMFSPEDLRLIKSGPSERRRFMDMELSQLNPAYYFSLQQYNHALKQRNALLRDTRASGLREAAALLLPWDEQLARLGASILLARDAFMRQLAGIASKLHGELAGGKETLFVTYAPALPIIEEQALIAALLAALGEAIEKDRLRGGTSIGPHRDDILLALNGADVRAFGSQGQQRTAALALKLSELSLMKSLGESPLLLLDDVLSELDSERQRMLATAMQGCQTFLTCTQLAGLKEAGLRDMTVFHVANGTITQ